LGDRSSWYCVLDAAGEVLPERKLATTPKAMKEVFSRMPRGRIALETGMHSPWVSRQLSELGHEVIVAHVHNSNPLALTVRKLVYRSVGLFLRFEENRFEVLRHDHLCFR
jgi:transposase